MEKFEQNDGNRLILNECRFSLFLIERQKQFKIFMIYFIRYPTVSFLFETTGYLTDLMTWKIQVRYLHTHQHSQYYKYLDLLILSLKNTLHFLPYTCTRIKICNFFHPGYSRPYFISIEFTKIGHVYFLQKIVSLFYQFWAGKYCVFASVVNRYGFY